MKVSVVIPVYNAERFLEKAIRSVLEQPETAEVIVADDKSTDASVEIARKLSLEDKRVIIIAHPDKQNHGTAATRNLGIKYASSEYVAFLDNDDFYLPGRFEKAKELFANMKDIDGVHEAIGTHAYDKEGLEAHMNRMKVSKQKNHTNLELTTMDEVINPEDLFEELLFLKKGWPHINGLSVKRSVFDKVGYFDEELLLVEDVEFFLRLSSKTMLVTGRINEPVAMRGVYKGNRTLTPEISKEALKKYRILAWNKIFKCMLGNKFSTKANRYILQTHLNYYSSEFVQTPLGLKRKIKKGINLLIIMIHHPKCILKVI